MLFNRDCFLILPLFWNADVDTENKNVLFQKTIGQTPNYALKTFDLTKTVVLKKFRWGFKQGCQIFLGQSIPKWE
jgi:hypothetical protein